MNNIVFIGMPASGKSTIGVAIAKHLGYDFIDTDLLIQKQENRLLKKIIMDEGLDGFLKIENQVNCGVMVEKTVISPGGSIVYCREAMEHFAKNAVIVYLKAAYEIIEHRIGDMKSRGVILKEGQSLRDLYNERTKLFEQYAQVTIEEDDLSLEETIEKVIKAMTKQEV